jgi:nucleotide-binding universal stress UspA family protein
VLNWHGDSRPLESNIREELTDYLKARVNSSLSFFFRNREPTGIDWRFVVADGRDAAEAITRNASEHEVDLIVMRSRRRPVAAALLGSTAEAVSSDAPCPVLVTHPQEREWISSFGGKILLKRILIAHDFSDYAELVMRYGLSLAQEYQTEVHLLHVLATNGDDGSEIARTPFVPEDAYRRAMFQAMPQGTDLWCDVNTVVRKGRPYQEVLSYAEENRIDLICMGAHGSGHSLQAFLGSTVDRVLRRAPCPVLIARPMARKVLVESERSNMDHGETNIRL